MHCHRGMLFSPAGPDHVRAVADGGLIVDDQGRIADGGPFAVVRSQYPGVPVTDWRPAAILPGLVDLHSHLAQYSAVALDGYELLPWLERCIYPAEAAFADPDHARAASRRFFAAALAHGTTTAALYVTVHEAATEAAFEAAEEAGLRAVIGKVMMDRNAPPELAERTDESLAASERLCTLWHGAAGGRLRYAFSPRFAVTCSAALLRGAAELARRYGALLQTHLAESPGELAAVARAFPAARTYTDVYAEAGLLGPRTIMAHCLHLAPGEWDLLAGTGTRIAHCPSSNFFLRSGVMDVHQARGRGLTVGLGSDVGAGPTLSLFEEMSHACFASRARAALEDAAASRLAALRGEFVALPGGEALYGRVEADLGLADPAALVGPAQALFMATLGGATALGMSEEIGSLDPGKWAVFVVVDLSQVDPCFGEKERTPDQVLSQIVFRTEPQAIRAAFVAGRPRVPGPRHRPRPPEVGEPA